MLIFFLLSSGVFRLRFLQGLGTKKENRLWQKISLSVRPWASYRQSRVTVQLRDPAARTFSPLLYSLHAWLPASHSEFWVVVGFFLQRTPVSLHAIKMRSVEVPLGVVHGLRCCHTNCGCNHTSSFPSAGSLTTFDPLSVQGWNLGHRLCRCCCDYTLKRVTKVDCGSEDNLGFDLQYPSRTGINVTSAMCIKQHETKMYQMILFILLVYFIDEIFID